MKFREIYFDQGDTIYFEGDNFAEILLIEEGQVEFVRLRGDRVIPVTVLGKGFFVGEVGVLERKSQPMTARARTDVRCIWVSSVEFLRELDTAPTVVRGMLVNLTRKLRIVTDIAYGKAEREE